MKLSDIKNTEPKRAHGDISSLKASIQECGLINPLTIDENGNLLAGRRRYQALAELHWDDVPVMVLHTNGNRLSALKIAIDENLKRKPLTDPENREIIALYDQWCREEKGEAKAGGSKGVHHTVVDGEGWTQDKTAQALGISQQAVSEAVQAEEAVKEHPEWAEMKTKQVNRKAQKEAQKEKIKKLSPTEGIFDVIVLDPPWASIRGEYDPDYNRSDMPYPTMTIDEIADIKLPSANDCVLWLWAPNLYLHEAFHLVEHWGFEFKNTLTWAKDKYGLGNWLRGQTEHCLLAIKGQPLWTGEANSTLLSAPRTTHSTKPDAFYKLVDKTCYGRKVDWFGRKERAGWVIYGDQRL